MNPAKLYLAFCFLALFAACRKSDIATISRSGHIDFSAPEIGQKSRYLLFEGKNYYSPQGGDMTYLPDTLIAELVSDSTGTGFMLKEYFTEGSLPLSSGYDLPKQTNARYTPIRFTSDSVIIGATVSAISNWSFLAWGRIAKLPLAQNTTNQVSILGWRTEPVTNLASFATEVEIQSAIYPIVNIAVFITALADDRVTYRIYDKDSGIVRAFYVTPWGNSGMGLDLMK